MTCGACGNPLKEGQAFCGRCGKPQKLTPPPRMANPISSNSGKGVVVSEPPDPGPMPKTSTPLWTEIQSEPAPKPKSEFPVTIPASSDSRPFSFNPQNLARFLLPIFLAVVFLGLGLMGKSWTSKKLDNIYLEKGSKACHENAKEVLQKHYQTQYKINADLTSRVAFDAPIYNPQTAQVSLRGNVSVNYLQVDQGKPKYISTSVMFNCIAQKVDQEGKSTWNIIQMTFE